MTPKYVLEALATRGFNVAIKVADATQDPRLIKAVLSKHFEMTGIARPIQVMGKNKRGKEVVLRMVEGCSPEQLEAIKDELARRKAKRFSTPMPYGIVAPVLKRGGNLTKEEIARRAAVLAQAA